MSGLRVVRAEVVPYTFDLGRPLVTAHATLRFRRGYLLRLEDELGRVGWGDAASFPGFGSGDDAVGCGLMAEASRLRGTSWDGVSAVEDDSRLHQTTPEVRYAVELALFDLLAKEAMVPLARLLSHDASDSARSHRLLASANDDALGADTVKLKVGRDLDAAVATVAELRTRLGPEVQLRLDANGCLERAEARLLLERVAMFRIELIEQPVAPGRLDDLAAVRETANALGIAVAADEDITDDASVEAVAQRRAADMIVVKPMFVGGLLAARRLASLAKARGLGVIVTHALESAIGRTGALQLAASLPGTHGLAWHPKDDLAKAPELVGARMRLPRGPGLGIEPRRSTHSGDAARKRVLISEPLLSSAELRPEHPAVEYDGTILSYKELAARARRVAAALVAKGVREGDRVALEGSPSHDWVVALHAIGLAGAIAAPLPHRPTPAERASVLDAFAPALVIDASESLPEAEPLEPARRPALESPRIVIATSGSTGTPRAVELTLEQLAWNAFGSALRLGHLETDRWLIPLPLHHIGGLSVLLRCAMASTTAVLQPNFEALRVANSLDSNEVSLVSLTPRMLERVLDERPPSPFPKRLRAILVGGGPCSEALLERARAIDAPLALTWGMTEAASQIATRLPGDLSPLDRGHPALPFVLCRERDGVLELEGPTVGGRLTTGDRGAVREGRVTVEGRHDDVIVRAGENLDPREIEAALEAHPQIAEAAVIGVPSLTHGHDVAALLVASGARPEEAELLQHCRGRLSAYKLPARFAWTTELPRTALGKLARASVRRALEDAHATKPVEQHLRQGGGAHVLDVDANVNELRPRADVVGISGSGEHVAERERTSTDLFERHRDVEAVVHPDRSSEVSLGAHDRQTDARLGQEPLDVRPRREQELLERGVAHLEHTPEKQDPRAIHVEEARSDTMNERHDHERRHQP